MTRINCVPVEELSQKHLVAEYRELPRIYQLAFDAWKRGEEPNDKRNPKEYVLGTGHVRFFYPRLGWLNYRFLSLVAEMKKRGYSPTYDSPPPVSNEIPARWFGWWEPTPEAIAINRQRIEERTK